MELETRFAKPSDEIVARLLRRCLGEEPVHVELVETGSSALVALTDDAAVRIARDPATATEMLRTRQLVDRLPPLPFQVPVSLGEPVQDGSLVAVATRRLPGQAHPSGSGDPVLLRQVLEAIHGIDVEPLRRWLAVPHAFAGGAAWLDVLRTKVVPLLPPPQQAVAREIIDRVAELDPPSALNHGDLAGSNMLWQDGRVTGVLDWDLAACTDPADDVASLALWHGWDLVDELADPDTVRRADLVRQTFGMQVVAFSLFHGRDPDEVSRAVQRAAERLPSSPLPAK